MTIKQLRILPPFAIGRLGSASEPMDNYSFDLDIDPDVEKPLGYRQIKAQPTLIVNENSGEVEDVRTPVTLEFKRDEKIRPVAPFLEVFAVTDKDELVPLTVDLLRKEDLTIKDISWQVRVSNRKVVRRTQNPDDLVHAKIDFSDHRSHTLHGRCRNFIKDASVNFGSVRFIRPNDEFPEIRFRFTPAEGLIYGPYQTSKGVAAEEEDPGYYQVPEDRRIYNHRPNQRNSWYHFSNAENETVPPSLFAIEPPAPSWLYDNIAISRGYLDDACDGLVEVHLKMHNRTLAATARICSAPPAMAPDSLFVRTLVDDLEQVIHGPEISANEPAEVTRARAQDIVRRAYETVRFMNVAVMNGNDFKGRPALTLDSMPQEEAADTERAIRPIMPSGTVDTLAIMALHQQAYAALQSGAAPWFLRLLRKPDEVADFTDHGRRKMPALMCGADNNYLALTWRQIDTIRKAALAPPTSALTGTAKKARLTPKNLSAQISYEARGNPICSRPITSVANCCPGLEVDFRAVWRRLFRGIELREHDNLVVKVDKNCDAVVGRFKGSTLKPSQLKKHRLLRVVLPGGDALLMMTPIWGPASSDTEGKILLTTSKNPNGLAPLEWSNALARVLPHKGSRLRCDFTAEPAEEQQPWSDDPKNYVSFHCEIRSFFEGDTAVISTELAEPGELTQGLCSPWQNDFRECSCYYWASARPDYVNVDPAESGLSAGDNWMQKQRTKSYVADDYADTRLIMYDDLFADWENLLKFQIGGRDQTGPLPVEAPDKKP